MSEDLIPSEMQRIRQFKEDERQLETRGLFNDEGRYRLPLSRKHLML